MESTNTAERFHMLVDDHTLSKDEKLSYTSMLQREPTMQLFVHSNHHVDTGGELRGFKCSVDANSDSSKLPINREMFWGCCCVEVKPFHDVFHPKVLRLMDERDQIKEKMLKVIQATAQNPKASADLHSCSPVMTMGEQTDFNANFRDAESWSADLPTEVGLFHAFVKNPVSGVREHKLFVLSFGGMRKASEQFYTMSLDLAGHCTSGELSESHEAWWLRIANQRCRLKFINTLCAELGLPLDTVADKYAFQKADTIPFAVADSFYHSMKLADNRSSVVVYNDCIDTTTVSNGMLIRQPPAEGSWILHGQPSGSVSKDVFGVSFGDDQGIGSVPSGTFVVANNNTGCKVVRSRQLPHVFCYDPVSGEEVVVDEMEKYALLDVQVLNRLLKDSGCVDGKISELMPIIIGIQKDI